MNSQISFVRPFPTDLTDLRLSRLTSLPQPLHASCIRRNRPGGARRVCSNMGMSTGARGREMAMPALSASRFVHVLGPEPHLDDFGLEDGR